MTDDILKICDDVIDELKLTPSGKCLYEYGNNDIPEEILPTVTNLKKIQQRLKERKYKTVEEWDGDIKSIIYYVEKYYGNDSYLFILAKQFLKKFTHLKKKVYLKDKEGWTKQFLKLQIKIANLVSEPVGIVRYYFPQQLITKKQNETLNEGELSVLLNDIRELRNPSDLLFFNNLFMYYDLKLDIYDDHLRVDLRSLPIHALIDLKNYVEERKKENTLIAKNN